MLSEAVKRWTFLRIVFITKKIIDSNFFLVLISAAISSEQSARFDRGSEQKWI